ncbi:uncharacterized, partial [Tachysurus ichikawai]
LVSTLKLSVSSVACRKPEEVPSAATGGSRVDLDSLQEGAEERKNNVTKRLEPQ